LRDALRAAGLALAGVGIVEAFLLAGLRPFAPLGWPGLGLVAAAAFFGLRGVLGALPVVAVYYAFCLTSGARFPIFYAFWSSSLTWLAGLAFLTALAYVLGGRLRRAQFLEQEIRAAHERLAMALEGSSAALWDVDLRTGRVYLSEGWAALTGAPEGATVTTVQELAATMHPEDIEPARRASVETMKGLRADYAVEHRVRIRDGSWRWILSRGRVTERDPASGRALRMIGTNVDITERKRVEENLQQVARYDPLTGAANRTLLDDRLRLAMARSRRAGARVAVLYLDIDRFKEINDRFGHAAGDAQLKGFAARLQSCVRETDTVARVGGDEFVILLENMKDDGDAAKVADKILAAVRRPMEADGNQLAMTTSIGIAVGSGEWSAEPLLKRADAALYRAKQEGRDAYRVADPAGGA
jgi:diguanylate cyclase (GGDEF)-like protein/PAS domain S-box-containing protein